MVQVSFPIKRHPNSTTQKYKARVVAQGFHQREELDFDEIFSLVVKPLAVRVMFTLLLQKDGKFISLILTMHFLMGT